MKQIALYTYFLFICVSSTIGQESITKSQIEEKIEKIKQKFNENRNKKSPRQSLRSLPSTYGNIGLANPAVENGYIHLSEFINKDFKCSLVLEYINCIESEFYLERNVKFDMSTKGTEGYPLLLLFGATEQGIYFPQSYGATTILDLPPGEYFMNIYMLQNPITGIPPQDVEEYFAHCNYLLKNTPSIYDDVTFNLEVTSYSSLSKDQNYIHAKTMTTEDGKSSIEQIQYFDGLGRPSQTVQKAITPGAIDKRKDLVSFQEYDGMGRESNSWLPVPITSNNGAYATPSKIIENAKSIYPYETSFYSKPVYESSPLNRIIEQYGPGADWQSKGKAVRSAYISNKSKAGTTLAIADSLSCGMIINTAPLTYSYTKNYDAGQLYVTRMKDEDNRTTYEFKDKLGQVVLTRQINGSQMLDTYYVYDDFGNLSAVFPPMASDLIYKDKSQFKAGSTVRGLYAYLYEYDNRNRCIQKKLPGVDWIYYVYDKADQLIFSQDGEQRKKSEWAFSIPDAFGRIVLTGICKNTLNITAEPLKSAVLANWTKASNITKGYTINGVTLTTPTITSANYYDHYEFLGFNGIPNTNDAKYVAEAGYGTQYTNAKGLLTGSLVAQFNGTSTFLFSAMYYDNRGRLIQTKSNNHLTGGFEKEYITYNFTGQPIKKKHVHSATGLTAQTEVYRYTYDHAGRLLTTHHKLNTGGEILIATNSYDDLGRLKTNTKGNQANLKFTYDYNIRSWTTKISSPLFTQNLFYNISPSGFANKQQYGGNITAMSWTVKGDAERKYGFSYDALSRLSHAAYNYQASGGIYSASYNYDKHGNITTISRLGKNSASTHGQVDNLTLRYNGNQLNNVHDAITAKSIEGSADFQDWSKDPNGTKKEYAYNANGAMTQDLNKGITTIQYNSLNLPTLMDIKSPVGEARNEYTYSARGQKLKVVQKWNPAFNTNPVIGSGINVSSLTTSKTTDYVGNIIYENGALKRILIDGGYIEGGKYFYYQTDHLGNNRVVADASGNIIQKTHYYPFGMAFAESTDGQKQPYKYNGKELDGMHGLNMYDYAARYMDPGVGRFTSVDPHTERYYNISPYAYAMNNPLRYIDPTGMDSVSVDNEGLVAEVYKNDGSNRFFDSKGNEFSFNDLDNADKDASAFEYAAGDRLFTNVSKSETRSAIGAVPYRGAIFFGSKLLPNGVSYGLVAWNSYNQADFAFSFLKGHTKANLIDNGIFRPDYDYSNVFFRFEGDDSMLYNLSDGGNFMWGAWTQSVGLGDTEVRIGSHANEVRQFRLGDSAADQRAIFRGRAWQK